MPDRRRSAGRAVSLLSLACLAAVVALVQPPAVGLATPLVLAIAGGLVPQAIDAWFGRTGAPPPVTAPGTVTSVIRAGPGDTASTRAAVLAAAGAGPTVVVTTDASVAATLVPLPVEVVVAADLAAALTQAAATITTDAALLMSARAFADHDAVARAAGLVRDGTPWVTGSSRPFNPDAFAPLVRDRLGRRMRAAARRRGLAIWESDATVVDPRLLRAGRLGSRPLGAMLRTDRHGGPHGVDVDDVLTVVAEPVDARAFWQASVARRRALAADLSDAARSARGPRRALALGLLVHELDGVRLALWLLAPWLLTLRADGVFRVSAWAVLPVVLVPAALRWWALRALHRVPLHPLEDLLALAYDAPGSVLAVPSAITRHVRPTRPWLPAQPLAVAALAFGAVAVLPLFDAGTTARRSVTVGPALTELGLLWLVTVRAIFQRNWSRSAYRVRARLPVRVDGHALHTRDVSPGGLGVVGELGWLGDRGSLGIEIELPGGGVVTGEGRVANRWRRGADEVVGMAFTVDAACRSTWLIELERIAGEAARGPRGRDRTASRPTVEPSARRWLRWILAAAVGGVSALALAVAALSAMGLRPLVVRSGSMRPALQVGDVVLVEDLPAAQLRVGDIATLERPDTGDTLTHRVIALQATGTDVAITTKGDANTEDEITTVATGATVGRVRWRIPVVGRLAARAGARSTRFAVGVLACGVVLGAAVVTGRRRAAS